MHTIADDRAARITRQHLQTAALLGADVIPLRRKFIAGGEIRTAVPTLAPASTVTSTPATIIVEPKLDAQGRSAEDDGVDSPEAVVMPKPKPTTLKPTTKSAAAAGAAPRTRKAKEAALQELLRRHDAECPHCCSVTFHTQTVFGEGNADAALMFVGEAPGAEEDRTGRPFVGRAGQKLDEIIKAAGLERADVYIANVLKSRPPDNRTPLRHEAEACGVYLAEQIRIIRPDAIVTLGGPATKLLLKTEVGITRLRGQWASYIDEDAGLVIPVMPTFHPAYLLRSYTPENRAAVWSDIQQVMSKLAESPKRG